VRRAHSHALHSLVQIFRVDPIAVMDQVSICVISRQWLAELGSELAPVGGIGKASVSSFGGGAEGFRAIRNLFSEYCWNAAGNRYYFDL
jgi:hypothetical protein